MTDRPPHDLRLSLAPGVGGMARVTKTLRDPESYDDRAGYETNFLGKSVPMPKLSEKLATAHDATKVLKYWNFSVVHSRARRVPVFSACNISGRQNKGGSDRSDNWHYDSRVKPKHQLIDECYGNEKDGFFSRGHMTKREDPVWGANSIEAEDDTFHATNQVPQMQGHNGGLWKSLEDHILKNARKDEQRACVITGPVLSKKDPVIHGVKIPVMLWKVVVFNHDDTGELTAVAYQSSQASFLPDVGSGSFVWGQFKRMQVPIAKIAKDTGLDFGKLGKIDVLKDTDASFAMALENEGDLILG